MYTKKGKQFVLSVYLWQGKVAPTPLSLILLSILYVLLRTLFVTSHPSCLDWKGEEHRIQNTKTYTTWAEHGAQTHTGTSSYFTACVFTAHILKFEPNSDVCSLKFVSNFHLLKKCIVNILQKFWKLSITPMYRPCQALYANKFFAVLT